MYKYDYEQVIEIIQNARRFGNLPGVEVSRIMLEKMGNPQAGLPYIHIAGTNGKGSTSAMLSSILVEAGLKVGVFTSPHLVDFRERITINGQMISKEDVTRIGNKLLLMDFEVSATMFDYCLVMAVIYFKEQNCDYAIMETGLGGRLDSTNALGIPNVSIITKIGYDHVAILGNTLKEIAMEKAGILKEGTYAVIETQEEEAMRVFETETKRQNVRCDFITREEIQTMSEYHIPLPGVHQWENAAAAVKAARFLLEEKDWDKIPAGLCNAKWPGRMDVLCQSPFLMVDGAHNGNGVLALSQSLQHLYPDEKFHFIMGVMADKDYENMVEEILPLAIDFITVTPESERALQGDELAKVIEQKGIPAKNVSRIEDAFDQWIKKEPNATLSDGKTIAFGSLYFVGDIMKFF